MSKSRAVVLVSGGMDSCVTAAIANLEHELAFLHINYGQRTEQKELKAFHALAYHFRVQQKLIADLTHLSAIGGSSLTDMSIEVTDADPKNYFMRKKEKSRLPMSLSEMPIFFLPQQAGQRLSARNFYTSAPSKKTVPDIRTAEKNFTKRSKK